EGQVRGVERMVEDDRYCIDILTQIAAVNTALEAVAFKMLDEHVRHCVAGALSCGDEADAREKTEELLQAVQRFALTTERSRRSNTLRRRARSCTSATSCTPPRRASSSVCSATARA